MKRVILILVLMYFMLLGLTSAFASTNQKEKNLKTGEIFAFNVDERLIYVSAKKMDGVKKAHCGTVVVIADWKSTDAMLISDDGVNGVVKLPSDLNMPTVTFTCKSADDIVVTW